MSLFLGLELGTIRGGLTEMESLSWGVEVVIGTVVAVAAWFAWLSFSEAFLKPVAIAFAHGITPNLLARGLVALDMLIPEILSEGVKMEEVERVVRRRLSLATGHEWTADQLMAVRRVADPIKFIEYQVTHRLSESKT